MIIDAHVHVWPEATDTYPFRTGADLSELPCSSFTVEQLFAMGDSHGVSKFNIVHKKQMRDSAYLTDVIRDYPEKCVGTAAVDPRMEHMSDELLRLAQNRIRACRIYPLLSKSDPVTWLQDKVHTELFELCRDLDLIVACMTGPECFAEIDRMCVEHPMTRVSIDHMGLIGRGGSIDPDALQKLRALSKHKNLFIKISGFHSQGAKTPPYHDLRLAATQIIQHFGADRCMWGSDGPYQFLPPHSLVDSLDFIDSLRISPVEKDAVFGGTAHNLYFSKK